MSLFPLGFDVVRRPLLTAMDYYVNQLLLGRFAPVKDMMATFNLVGLEAQLVEGVEDFLSPSCWASQLTYAGICGCSLLCHSERPRGKDSFPDATPARSFESAGSLNRSGAVSTK